jgi:hypothetical protein
MRTVLGVLAGLCLFQGAAVAGRRPFLFAYDTATVPEGDAEIESWLDLIQPRHTGQVGEWRWFLGPSWSPVDGVEVSALTAFAQAMEDGAAAELWAELLEGRVRVLRSQTLGDLTLQLDLRIALIYDIPHQVQPQIGWVKRAGRIVGTVQAGYARGFAGNDKPEINNVTYDWVTWRAGIAFDAIRGEISAPLQIGIESFGELVLTGKGDQEVGQSSTVTVGPTFSVARGRLWLTAGVLFGILDESPQAIVRGIIGLAL